MTTSQRFIENMRHLRLALRWSQEKLASEYEQHTGRPIGGPAITKIEWMLSPETSKRERARGLSLDEAIGIAAALGHPLNAMIGDAPVTVPEDVRIAAELRECRAALDGIADRIDRALVGADS